MVSNLGEGRRKLGQEGGKEGREGGRGRVLGRGRLGLRFRSAYYQTGLCIFGIALSSFLEPPMKWQGKKIAQLCVMKTVMTRY